MMHTAKRTPLYETHAGLGAKMIDFGGWEMPLQYSSIIEEHLATRERAGLFDVSHMGEIMVKGPGARAALDRLVTADLTKLRTGRIQYSFITNDRAGVVDDLLIYGKSEDELLLVVNAANTDKDFLWLCEGIAAIDMRVSVENQSADYGQIAIQGPLAQSILAKCTDYDLATIRYFAFAAASVCGCEVLVSRSGYTGEDGFEIYCRSGQTRAIWDGLLAAGRGQEQNPGQGQNLIPVGLGARDTLRFESALPLYGHELSDEITPVEAGLAVFVKTDKTPYLGSDVLAAQISGGAARRLVGIELTDRGIPRQGYAVQKDGSQIGFVTSGMYSPTFKKGLAMALLSTGASDGAIGPGDTVDVDIRGKTVGARIVPLPFYRKKSGSKL